MNATDDRHIRVVDVPASATAAEAEALLAGVIEQGYYVLAVVPGSNSGARAFFSVARAKGRLADSDGKEVAAMNLIRTNAKLSGVKLSALLAENGIIRSAGWVNLVRRRD